MTVPLQWARRTVVAVFLLGLVVVVGPAVWNADSLFRDPFIGTEARKTVETFGPDGRLTGREVTTSPSGGSLVERSTGWLRSWGCWVTSFGTCEAVDLSEPRSGAS